MAHTLAGTPKYQQVYAALRREIQSGRLTPGARLPSEADLVKRFGASRITVGRAVRDLQVAGLVERRAGSGTFVAAPRTPSALSFGLLIPDLGETDIFESICHGMMASPLAREHALIWGSVSGGRGSKEDETWRLCRQYIDRGVSGVFFAPLEGVPSAEDVNQRLAAALEDARIPIVLLDRPLVSYPQRGPHDLVGIDNRRAGFVMTDHLLGVGATRIAFVAMPHMAATVDAREAGYREALFKRGAPVDAALVHRLDPADPAAADRLMSRHPDAVVCANDLTAGHLMHTLLRRGLRIPADVRLSGIDDAAVASLLPVPLTTMRQPSRAIGDAALAAMLDRVARPNLPVRDILLHCDLVVRDSCGAHRRPAAQEG